MLAGCHSFWSLPNTEVHLFGNFQKTAARDRGKADFAFCERDQSNGKI
jgi:hypothetical protein